MPYRGTVQCTLYMHCTCIRFTTYTGVVRIHLSARRRPTTGQVAVAARVLRDEEGVDSVDNDPHITMDVHVNCDVIKVTADGQEFVAGYDFGRDGVKDLGWKRF